MDPLDPRTTAADEIIDLLALEPLPVEGGWLAVVRRDEFSSAIYFLVRPGGFSALHRLQATEIWHHYAGAPTRMLLLGPDGAVDRPVLGTDLAAGQRPMVPVPAGTWMGAATTGAWSLLGTTMAPRFEEEGFELGRRQELTEGYPEAADDIGALTRPKGEEP